MRDLTLVQRLVEVPGSELRRVDSRLKVLLAALFVIALASIPAGETAPFVPLTGLLVLIALVGRVPLRAWAARLMPLFPFVISTLFIPFLHEGRVVIDLPWLPAVTDRGLERAGGVLLRMFTIGGTMALLAASTPFQELLDALRALRLPGRLVMTLELLFRYLFLLVDEGQRMGRAWLSRGGMWRSGAAARRSLGGVVGVLFIRSYERGERVHRSMLARGYDEHAVVIPAPRPSGTQLIGAALVASLVVVLRWVSLAGGALLTVVLAGGAFLTVMRMPGWPGGGHG